MAFLPVTKEEIAALGWERPDIVLVSADAYVDSPYSGVAVIGQTLSLRGYKVAVLSQPNPKNIDEFRSLGEPRLFWGVSCGCVDSMVANYTASGRRRRQDDFTPGAVNDRRPDRASIVYSNAIRAAFKPAKPILLGGIEASLRRVSHYDFWSGKVRRPVVCDAKADALIYGMGERAVLEFAAAVKSGASWHDIPGLCRMASEKDFVPPPGAVELASFAEVSAPTEEGRRAFARAFKIFCENQDPLTARALIQKVDNRYLVHNVPAWPLEREELDGLHSVEWELDAPAAIRSQGEIRALDTIRFGITTHRGCYGQCNFCAIAVHQGRRVVSRSKANIVEEARRICAHRLFKGTITDVGGPTANMYGFDCDRKRKVGACAHKRCLFPETCKSLNVDHSAQVELLADIRRLKGVKHVFVSSGIRPDLIAADRKCGSMYIEAIARNHVSGQLKLAPEHVSRHVLEFMGKPSVESLLEFKKKFDAASRKCGKRQFLTYYFIAAHPGCTEKDMHELKRFATQKLNLNPEQVQIFTPTPMTAATCMYYTGYDPDTMEKVYVARNLGEKERQKSILTSHSARSR